MKRSNLGWACVGCCVGLFHGCNTSVTTDIVKHSVTEATMPSAPVRLPPALETSSYQGALVVSGSTKRRSEVAIQHGAGGSGYYVETDGRSELLTSPVQGGGSVNIWKGDRHRFGLAVEWSSNGTNLGGEYGYRFDVGPISMEMFGGMGMANSNSTVDWGIKTTWRDEGGAAPDSSLEERTTNPGHYWWSGRGGIHVGARRSGPWGELELSSPNLFEAPSSKSQLWLEQTSVAAGWSHFFDNKAITGFVRAHWVGGSWVPTAGVQLTGNVPIPAIEARR